MKFLFISFILLIWGDCWGQEKYRCIYMDTTTFSFPDSILKLIKANLNKNVIPGPVRDGIADGFPLQEYYSIQEREVFATKDSTVIRFNKRTRQGNLNDENFSDSLLLKNGEIYREALTETGFSRLPVTSPKKIFHLSGDTIKIMGYKCAGYISTDSLCTIWIASSLPSYINPGIRTGTIKGAVVAFELREGKYLLKSRLVRIE